MRPGAGSTRPGSSDEDLPARQGLTYRRAYWGDPAARRAFKEFLLVIHGLDLTLWEEKGFWDELYTPFSLFAGDRVVSSVCLYTMDLSIRGCRRRVGQFSGVGTLPAYRRRGLAFWLTEEAIAWASATHEGFFLFADDEALPFYARCGCTPLAETGATLAVASPRPRPGLRRLDPADAGDLALIHRHALARSPVSDMLGAWNPKLLMFHCLYTLREHAHFIDDLDVVVFCKTAGGRLELFDVVGPRVPTFAELHGYLGSEPHREVRFHFMPDKMGVEPTGSWTPVGNNAHTRAPLELSGPGWFFPFSAHV